MECSVWRDATNKTRGACAPRSRLTIRFSAREMLPGRSRCYLAEVGAYRDPRLYAVNVFAEQFSHSVQPLVPNRLFINNSGGKDGEGQPGGGNVLETLLSLILSEKAGINISGDASTSRPLEDFIQKFTGNGGQSDRGQAKQETASIATAGKRDNSG
jgi:hypothetical protein